MAWGWIPALIWVLIGTVFIGAVHDFGSLITSVKHGGSSMGDIAEDIISKKAKILLSLFIWLSLILVVAVFGYFCASTFVNEPGVVLPSLGIIPVAVLIGYLLYYLKVNSIFATVLGIFLFAGLILLGRIIPLHASRNFWLVVLFIYCYFASILPVNILLQPRDYLCSFLLFLGVGAGYLGLVIFRPEITMPGFSGWKSGVGYLWPSLFITVACGAVSGFHSLIAAGTTSKQLVSQSHAKNIGYGAMVVEGFVAILAIICVAALLKKGDDFSVLLKNVEPIKLFGQGYGNVTKAIFGKHGTFIAITILNAFILTTLDTGTRITRYISEELFKIKNRYLSTLAVLAISGGLAVSGKWELIWKVFGASNQLVAALVLLVLSCWLLIKGKRIVPTLIPAGFMLFTTVASLLMQARDYLRGSHVILFIICVLLIGLTGFILWEVVPLILAKKKYAQ